MRNPLLSLIIPVYNAEPFIEQCILSALGHTLREIEVIAVNDGSTDQSAAILEKYAATDNRLQVYHHPNQGISCSRNFGMGKAKGQFIAFADADDWLEPNMIERLLTTVTAAAGDWAICNVSIHEKDGTVRRRLTFEEQRIVDIEIQRPDVLRKLMQYRFDYANWNKLYKADIISHNGIRFDESMFLWEDLLFNLMYLHYSKRIVLVDEALYHYRVQQYSITHSRNNALVCQYNLLFRQFVTFSASKDAFSERTVFKQEIARIFYNNLVYVFVSSAFQDSTGFIDFFRKYYRQLLQVDCAIFYYPQQTLNGLQGLKKKMLSNGWLLPFAWITGVAFYVRQQKNIGNE